MPIHFSVEVGIPQGRDDAIHTHNSYRVILDFHPLMPVIAILPSQTAIHVPPILWTISLQGLRRGVLEDVSLVEME